MDRVLVVLESNTLYPRASYIMRGAPHDVTYDDLIAADTQGEPAACAGA